MTVLLTILVTIVIAGLGFSIYNSKVSAPAFEAEKNRTKHLIRELLPGVKIHAVNSPRDVHLTYLGTEYVVYGPHWKDGEDGGSKTSVFSIDAGRKVTCVWQHFHEDKKELNARYFREALGAIKEKTHNQPPGPKSELVSGGGSS
jgi:hypothetical protein